ncbi:MAG: hypothetical protein ACJ74W_01375 [Pyrinomonadaceae bacterium]
MPELELCDSCRIHFPAEYAEACEACGATLCPICDEDGCKADQHKTEQLPLAA